MPCPPSRRAPVLPPAKQIQAAIAAAPAEMRDGAGCGDITESKKLVKLREEKNDMICLASDPDGKQFHVACYHKLLEPFMARGRELRAQGVKDDQVDTVGSRRSRAASSRCLGHLRRCTR